MGDDDKTNSSKEIIVRFGLKIERLIQGKNVKYNIIFHNEGISNPEVILLVEAWLEKMKEDFKQPIKDGFTFFKPDKQ